MRRNQRGVTIMEALLAAGIVGIVLVAVNQYFSSTFQTNRSQNAIAVRDQIYHSLRGAVNPESLFASMNFSPPAFFTGASNVMLMHCVDPDSNTSCALTDPTQQAPFVLRCPDCVGDASLAGPPTPAKLYDGDGRACAVGSTDCDAQFQAISTFWATCPLDPVTKKIPANCKAAETIWVRIQVRPLVDKATCEQEPDRGRKTGAGQICLDAIPPDQTFGNRKKHAIPISTKDIRLVYETNCKLPGQRITGYDQFGRPICTCVTDCTCPAKNAAGAVLNTSDPNYDPSEDVSFGDCSRRKPDSGKPACACKDSECDPLKEFMAGLDKTNKAICISRQSLEKCTKINIQQNGDCGEGSQMVQVIYGVCSHKRQPKGGGWKINCEDDKATCCQMAF